MSISLKRKEIFQKEKRHSFVFGKVFEISRKKFSCHIHFKDENGDLAPLSWFNKGAKTDDTLYVGTPFTVLAGNLCCKNSG